MDGKAFTGKGIDDGQRPEPPAIEQGVRHEIHGPDLVRTGSRQPIQPVRRHEVATGSLGTQVQPFFTVKPENPLMVYGPAFPPQQDMNTTIAVTLPHSRDFLDPKPQRRLVGAMAAVTMRPPTEPHRCTAPAFADPIPLLQPPDNLPPPTRLQSFFARTS